MRSTQDILALLNDFMPYAEKRYGIKRIGVFGSVARGEQNDDSDVDICYEGHALSFLTMDLFQSELEKLLGCKVDTVRVRDNMNPVLRERIRKEGVYVR